MPEPPIILKLNQRFNTGTLDCYYAAPENQSLWIEYKIYPNKVTPPQQESVDKLHHYKHNVAIMTRLTSASYETTITVGDTIIKTSEPWRWIAQILKYPHAILEKTW